MADMVEASFDVPFKNPFGSYRAREYNVTLLNGIMRTAIFAESVGMVVKSGVMKMPRGKVS